jgi:uncharacterized protein
MTGGSLRISRITLFPVKGLAGVEVAARRVGPRGLEGDRRWMVVDAEGTFLSQRTHPRMVLVQAALEPGADGGEWIRLTRRGGGAEKGGGPPRGDGAEIGDEAEGRNEAEVFRFPARPEGGGNAGGEELEVEIWGDRVQAVAPHPEGDAWLSDFLGAPVRLVYQPDRSHRPTDPHFAPGAEVSMADGYPILVLTRASLDELNRRLAESGSGPLPMDRFRPNLVVEGPVAPHAEDGWRRFQVGGVAMAGVKRCARCAVTTVDPATAERGKEPLRTLAHYRRDPEGRVFFGQNVVPLGVGAVAVGDRVELLEEGWVGP